MSYQQPPSGGQSGGYSPDAVVFLISLTFIRKSLAFYDVLARMFQDINRRLPGA
jgi:hypothetical protein